MAAYKTNKMYKVIGKKVLQNWALYLFLLPSAVILLLLNIIPMYGIQIAFKKFVANQGIWGSKWIGFSNFSNFFSSYMFSSLIKNTLAISLYSIVVSFPFPILLALLLNYCIHPKLKKTTQMVTYAPHFISTVVLIGMINVFFSSEGLVNTVTELLGGSKVSYLESRPFSDIYTYGHISGREPDTILSFILRHCPEFLWRFMKLRSWMEPISFSAPFILTYLPYFPRR